MNTRGQQLLEDIFISHSANMVRYVYRKTNDSELAKDLVQEAFLTATRKIADVEKHQNPVAWLYKTLGFLTQRELDKAYHNAEILAADAATMQVFPEPELPMDMLLPKGLTPAEMELFLMRTEQKLTYEEIAKRLGCTEAAVRQQYSRVCRKCRVLMEASSGA